MAEVSRRDTIEVLRETIHSIRLESYPMVSSQLVNTLLEIEIRLQEVPERAIAELEQLITNASKGAIGQG